MSSATTTASDPAIATGNQAKLNEAVSLMKKRELRTKWLLLAPALVIICLFGIAPLSVTLLYSFLEPGTYHLPNFK